MPHSSEPVTRYPRHAPASAPAPRSPLGEAATAATPKGAIAPSIRPAASRNPAKKCTIAALAPPSADARAAAEPSLTAIAIASVTKFT